MQSMQKLAATPLKPLGELKVGREKVDQQHF